MHFINFVIRGNVLIFSDKYSLQQLQNVTDLDKSNEMIYFISKHNFLRYLGPQRNQSTITKFSQVKEFRLLKSVISNVCMLHFKVRIKTTVIYNVNKHYDKSWEGLNHEINILDAYIISSVTGHGEEGCVGGSGLLVVVDDDGALRANAFQKTCFF